MGLGGNSKGWLTVVRYKKEEEAGCGKGLANLIFSLPPDSSHAAVAPVTLPVPFPWIPLLFVAW